MMTENCASGDISKPARRPRFELVIFDFDGTLCDSLQGLAACSQKALARFGFPQPTVEEVKATIGLSVQHSMRVLTKFRCSESQIPEIVEVYRTFHRSEAVPLMKLFDGAAKVLTDLRQAATNAVLVSNKDTASLERWSRERGIRELSDFVV